MIFRSSMRWRRNDPSHGFGLRVPMNRDQRFVANPLARTIERQLRPGEILIWIGQPDPKRFSREIVRACLFQLALMAIFIPVSLFVISRISQAEKTVVPMLLLVGAASSDILQSRRRGVTRRESSKRSMRSPINGRLCIKVSAGRCYGCKRCLTSTTRFARLTRVKSEGGEESNDTQAVPISSSAAKAMIT